MPHRPRRFIIFNDPPSTTTVRDHDTWLNTNFTWHKLLIPRSPSPEPAPDDEPELDMAPMATPGNPDQAIPSPPSVLLGRLAAFKDGADMMAAVADESLSQFRDAPSPPKLHAGHDHGRAPAERPSSSVPSRTSSALMPPPARQPRRSVAKRARESGLSEAEEAAGQAQGLYAHNLWGEGEEESYAVWQAEATRVEAGADETVEDSFEGTPQWQGTQLLPPPSDSAATASQPTPRVLHSRRSNTLAGLHVPASRPPGPTPAHLQDYTFSTDSDATDGSALIASSPALPPNLPWDHFNLRDLVALRAGLARQGQRAGCVQASVLGLVVDVAEPREFGERGKRRAGFEVEDPSGGRVSVVLWEEWVSSWHGVVRRGDVVFLGDLKLNLYAAKLQAQPTHTPLSRAQICWRLAQLDPADASYGFAPKWREISPEADKVMRVVEWAGVVYRGVFEGASRYG